MERENLQKLIVIVAPVISVGVVSLKEHKEALHPAWILPLPLGVSSNTSAPPSRPKKPRPEHRSRWGLFSQNL